MSLTFYKPNKANKGSLLSINFTARTDKDGQKGDKSFYVNLVSQTSWNESERTGGFKDGKKIVIKLSPTEISGIIHAINKNITLAQSLGQEYVYHDGDKTASTIYFGPYFKKEKQGDKWVDSSIQVGFSLRVVRTEKVNKENKEQLALGLTYAETELLVNYLKDGLNHIFSSMYSEDITRLKVKKERAVPEIESKQPEPEEPPEVDF
jgi:hypothetical protein